MYGPGDANADGEPTFDAAPTAPPAPARHRRPMSAPAALALTVTGLLAAFGAGAALLPESFTGSGAEAETPAAAIAALAPGAGGAAPAPSQDGAPPSDAPPVSASPSAPASSRPAKPSTGATPSAKATTRATTAAPKPKRKVTPTATPKAGTPTAGADQVSQENEVVRLVNVERDRAGCGSVRLDTRLRTAIRLHVEELGTHGDLYISHVSDDGRTFAQRARAQGYQDPGGENVARGQRNAADVMNSWMNSDGHRANILNCGFKSIGVGRAEGVDGTFVWGQIFGRS